MRLNEAASSLKISKHTLRNWCRRSLVPYDWTPGGRRHFTIQHLDEIRRMMAGPRR